MKRVLAGAAGIAFAGALFLVPNAVAEPSDACGGGPVANTSSSVTVCVTGTGVADGSTTATQTGATSGYIIADGDSTNPAPLGGYIGVEGGSGGVTPVGSCSGDYTPGAGDPILPPSGETDPACSPAP